MQYTAWIAAAILAWFCYVWYRDNNRRQNGASRLPPAPFRLPIVGNRLAVMGKNMRMFSELQKTLGNVFELKFFDTKLVYMSSYAALKEALVTRSDAFSQKFRSTEIWLKEAHGHAILGMDGPVLREKRKFTLQHLRNFGFGKSAMETSILDETTKMCNYLDKHDGGKMDIKNFCFMPVFNVIWGVLGGKTYAYDDDTAKMIRKAIHEAFASISNIAIVGFHPALKHLPGDPFQYKRHVSAVDALANFVQTEMDEHSRTLRDGEPRDYIDAYLMEIKKRDETGCTDENECFTTPHLRFALVDLILAGVETTTSTMDWAILYMAVWPEIQEKVQKELDKVIGHRRAQFSDMAVLPYTKATMMEVQRMSSVICFGSLRVATKPTTLLGYTISKGTLIIPNYYGVHREKEVWGDPDVFRPERFITEDNKTVAPESWIPYSIGNRNCIGESLARMEVFILFAALMQRYSFQCVTGEPLPSLDQKLRMTFQPQPFQLLVKQRARTI